MDAILMIHFFVPGVPKTKGSHRAIVRGGHAIVLNDCTTEKPWAEHVYWTAREAAKEQGWTALDGPMEAWITFHMPRPQRLGKKRTMVLHDRRPDLDKCLRSVVDALTGALWNDDAQVWMIVAVKVYADFGEPSGVGIKANRT